MTRNGEGQKLLSKHKRPKNSIDHARNLNGELLAGVEIANSCLVECGVMSKTPQPKCRVNVLTIRSNQESRLLILL